MSMADREKMKAKLQQLVASIKNASQIPGVKPGGCWPIARKFENGMVQDIYGHPGRPTKHAGVYISPAWTRAMGTYRPGQKIDRYGLPENDQVRAMVKRGEIDP